MWVYVSRIDDESYVVYKHGQLPEFDITVSRELRKIFDTEDFDLYKKARVSINHNFGIGACIYLRRLVENHITPLLQAHLEKRIEEFTHPMHATECSMR
ncbi:hypothetical protein BH18ACI4_BH18ACI4_00750 [soil metagenome]